MKNNKIHIAFFILGSILFLLFSCKTRKKEVPPFLNLNFQVIDETSKPVISGNGYLFRSQKEFEIAYQACLKGDYSSFESFRTGKVDFGNLNFKGVPSGQPYWVLVQDASNFFKDYNVRDSITGIRILKYNANSNFFVNNYPDANEIFGTIKVEPVNSLIKISSASGSPSNRISEEFLFGEGKENYVQVRSGQIPYMFHNSTCLWTGEINAIGGKVIPMTLGACDLVPLIFTYNGALSQNSIKIYIGQKKNDPQVAELYSGKNTDTVFVKTEASYTYFAELPEKKCVWQKQIFIRSNLVRDTLKACP